MRGFSILLSRVGRALLFGALVVAASACCGSAGQPAVVSSLEGITEYRLDNGLGLLLCPDSSVATITVNAVYHVGSRQEGLGETGMAHLLEHMLIKETENIPNLREALIAIGAEFNGSTWYDRTQFHETFAADADNLAFVLRLEAERMHRAVIRPEELALEMKVITNEFQYVENDPETILSNRMMAAAYDWHAYGRPTIGSLSDIQSYPIENLRRFYHEHYRPDNATVVIAGRFDPARALALASKHLGAVPRPDAPLPRTWTVEPPQEGPRRVLLERVASTPRAGLMYHVPAGAHPDAAALAVLMTVLTDPASGILVREFVTTGRAAAITGEPASLQLAEPGVFDIRVELLGETAPVPLLEEVAASCESVAERVTDDDVARARARLLKKNRRQFADLPDFAVELSEWIAQGDWRGFFVQRDRVASATTEQIRDVARRYLRASNRTLGAVVSTEAPDLVRVPTSPGVAELMDDYRGVGRIPVGEYMDVSLDAFAKHIQEYHVEPGLAVALLPKHTRGGLVTVRVRLRYGTPQDLRGRRQAAWLLPSLLMRGTKKHDRQELNEALDLLQTDLTLTGFEGVLAARVDSDGEHVVEAIKLLGEVLRKPAFDAKEFEILRRERLAKLGAQLDDPVERCFNAVRRGLYDFPNDSPYYKPTIEESVAELRALELADVRKLYQELLGASHTEVAVAGDFTAGEVLVALGESFRDWDSPAACVAIDPPYHPVAEAQRRIVTPDKPMAIVGYATLFEMRDDDPDYPAMLLAQQILGGDSEARLGARLRHAEGLSYHAASAMQVEPRIACANLFGYAFCTPVQADTCLTGLREEVSRLIREGVTDEELAKAREAWRRDFELNLGDDAEFTSELVSLEENGRSLGYYKQVLVRMESLTAADVNRVLRDRLGAAEFLSVQAGDF